MPFSVTLTYISISAQGSRSLIKMNCLLLVTLISVSLPVSSHHAYRSNIILNYKHRVVFLQTPCSSFDQHRTQRLTSCSCALRWMQAGSLILEVRHNKLHYRQEVWQCDLLCVTQIYPELCFDEIIRVALEFLHMFLEGFYCQVLFGESNRVWKDPQWLWPCSVNY